MCLHRLDGWYKCYAFTKNPKWHKIGILCFKRSYFPISSCYMTNKKQCDVVDTLQTRTLLNSSFQKNQRFQKWSSLRDNMFYEENVNNISSSKTSTTVVAGKFSVVPCVNVWQSGDETLTIYCNNVLTVLGKNCAVNAWCHRLVMAPFGSTLHLAFKDA